MISEEQVLHMVQRCGMKIDAFGGPVVDKFEMLVTFARQVEDMTERRIANDALEESDEPRTEKLTAQDIAEIRRLAVDPDISKTFLMKKFGVSRQTIYRHTKDLAT